MYLHPFHILVILISRLMARDLGGDGHFMDHTSIKLHQKSSIHRNARKRFVIMLAQIKYKVDIFCVGQKLGMVLSCE